MTVSRAPVQIVEIDVDQCTRVFGTSPCTAALSADVPRKCYNSYATCRDPENFDKGTLTLRFSKNQTGLPKGLLVYPALQSVSTNPASINLGGIDSRTGPLGKRARVRVQLLDFTDSDTGTDIYQSERVSGAAQHSGVGYDPSRGSYFGKWLARNPYYIGRALRVLDGYEGQALGDMRTRHYVITEWAGPDMSGRVTITAKDVLDLADNQKALCPTPNKGVLSTDIEEGYGFGVDLLPVGIGDAEYAAAGRAAIGSEVVSFTRSGDTVTLTARGLDGTEIKSHSADDLFQQCYRVDGVSIDMVAADLLENFAGIDPAFIPVADWADEAIWISGFMLSATIAKPTGVSKLIGELAELGVYWWWDDVAQEIRMRTNRPLAYGETLAEIADVRDIVEGSLAPSDLHDHRLTQVVFWHGQINATGSATDGANYARAYVAANDGGNPARYNQDRVHEIFCRWLGGGNDIVAGAVTERLAVRFEDTPREATFVLDAKDRNLVAPADLFEITTRVVQDETGDSLTRVMQVTAIEHNEPGHSTRVTAVTNQFLARYGYWLEDPQPDYDTASDDDVTWGAFWFDDGEADFGDGTGPYQYF